MNNVIDFAKYKEDRQRDEHVVQYVPYGLQQEETWHESAAIRDDVTEFVQNWVTEFNRVAEEIREVIHDIDKLDGGTDQEEPLA